MASDDTSETSTLKQQTPELECLHQCVRCGGLYSCKEEGQDRCQRAFYSGKCLLC
jgi:hypothetical protein